MWYILLFSALIAHQLWIGRNAEGTSPPNTFRAWILHGMSVTLFFRASCILFCALFIALLVGEQAGGYVGEVRGYTKGLRECVDTIRQTTPRSHDDANE